MEEIDPGSDLESGIQTQRHIKLLNCAMEVAVATLYNIIYFRKSGVYEIIFTTKTNQVYSIVQNQWMKHE